MPDLEIASDASSRAANVDTESPMQLAAEQVSRPEQTVDKGVLTNALDAIAQSGSTDQLRGYANTVLGETKLSLGLAVGSAELALIGIAQKALGEAQKYIGEAKLSAETETPNIEVSEAAADVERIEKSFACPSRNSARPQPAAAQN